MLSFLDIYALVSVGFALQGAVQLIWLRDLRPGRWAILIFIALTLPFMAFGESVTYMLKAYVIEDK